MGQCSVGYSLFYIYYELLLLASYTVYIIMCIHYQICQPIQPKKIKWQFIARAFHSVRHCTVTFQTMYKWFQSKFYWFQILTISYYAYPSSGRKCSTMERMDSVMLHAVSCACGTFINILQKLCVCFPSIHFHLTQKHTLETILMNWKLLTLSF